MVIYACKRLIEAIPTLIFVLFLTFTLLRFAPGSPFDSDRVFPPQIQQNLNAKYGLDQPLLRQFGIWISDTLHGDLHESFQYLDEPVSRIIAQALPISLLMGTISLLLSVLTGIGLGAMAAQNPGGILDSSILLLTITWISLPSYLVASLLILVFSLSLAWLPPALLEDPSSWILPVLTLSTRPVALIARLTRSSVLEALQSDYIRTALAKGLSRRQVLLRHALANSLIPVVTLLGPLTANLITGSFVVEIVFQIPGLGKHFVSSVLNRDYPLVMGITLIYGIILIGCNLLVDLAYAWLDPRIRLT